MKIYAFKNFESLSLICTLTATGWRGGIIHNQFVLKKLHSHEHLFFAFIVTCRVLTKALVEFIGWKRHKKFYLPLVAQCVNFH